MIDALTNESISSIHNATAGRQAGLLGGYGSAGGGAGTRPRTRRRGGRRDSAADPSPGYNIEQVARQQIIGFIRIIREKREKRESKGEKRESKEEGGVARAEDLQDRGDVCHGRGRVGASAWQAVQLIPMARRAPRWCGGRHFQ